MATHRLGKLNIGLSKQSGFARKAMMWVVRAGENGRLFDDFRAKSVIAIGWNALGDLSSATPNQVREAIQQSYPGEKSGWLNMTVSQVSRFRFEMKPGDHVVTYNPGERRYLIGEISSPYGFDDKLLEYHQVRQVRWKGEVLRDALSTATKNKLGSISTLFQVDADAEKEILTRLSGGAKPKEPEAEKEELEEAKDVTLGQAHELIKDAVVKLDWEDAQDLVAGVLRAMGYRTIVSPPGPDGRRDVMASPDGLGLEDPRIIVQVKHKQDQVGGHEMTSFTGILRPGSKGLYVSTGGFSKEAKLEANRAEHPVALVDLDGLVDLITQNYDKFDSEAKALLPLTKIYWPA